MTELLVLVGLACALVFLLSLSFSQEEDGYMAKDFHTASASILLNLDSKVLRTLLLKALNDPAGPFLQTARLRYGQEMSQLIDSVREAGIHLHSLRTRDPSGNEYAAKIAKGIGKEILRQLQSDCQSVSPASNFDVDFSSLPVAV